jgi:hypothetical protein
MHVVRSGVMNHGNSQLLLQAAERVTQQLHRSIIDSDVCHPPHKARENLEQETMEVLNLSHHTLQGFCTSFSLPDI